MNDGEDPSKELVHTCNLVQVTLTLLHYFQDIHAKQVCAMGGRERGRRRGGGGEEEEWRKEG